MAPYSALLRERENFLRADAGVNQSLERVKRQTVFKSPKTPTSRRTITLPALTDRCAEKISSSASNDDYSLALVSLNLYSVTATAHRLTPIASPRLLID